eukprot:270706-Hanusia_phi.AAC.1
MPLSVSAARRRPPPAMYVVSPLLLLSCLSSPAQPRTSTVELVELLEQSDLWMDFDVLKGMGVRK